MIGAGALLERLHVLERHLEAIALVRGEFERTHVPGKGVEFIEASHPESGRGLPAMEIAPAQAGAGDFLADDNGVAQRNKTVLLVPHPDARRTRASEGERIRPPDGDPLSIEDQLRRGLDGRALGLEPHPSPVALGRVPVAVLGLDDEPAAIANGGLGDCRRHKTHRLAAPDAQARGFGDGLIMTGSENVHEKLEPERAFVKRLGAHSGGARGGVPQMNRNDVALPQGSVQYIDRERLAPVADVAPPFETRLEHRPRAGFQVKARVVLPPPGSSNWGAPQSLTWRKASLIEPRSSIPHRPTRKRMRQLPSSPATAGPARSSSAAPNSSVHFFCVQSGSRIASPICCVKSPPRTGCAHLEFRCLHLSTGERRE